MASETPDLSYIHFTFNNNGADYVPFLPDKRGFFSRLTNTVIDSISTVANFSIGAVSKTADLTKRSAGASFRLLSSKPVVFTLTLAATSAIATGIIKTLAETTASTVLQNGIVSNALNNGIASTFFNRNINHFYNLSRYDFTSNAMIGLAAIPPALAYSSLYYMTHTGDLPPAPWNWNVTPFSLGMSTATAIATNVCLYKALSYFVPNFYLRLIAQGLVLRGYYNLGNVLNVGGLAKKAYQWIRD